MAHWRATAGPPYFIAHRGAGIVVPEHTLESYRAALAWGASCLEISVAMTSDEMLICMHDPTYDRTTNLKGAVADQPSSVLEGGRVVVPRLGRRWQGAGAPRIPLLSDVLQDIGSRAVLCIEAKDDAAFDPVLALVRRSGLVDSVFAKLFWSSERRIEQAKAAGLPVFVYVGSADDLASEELESVLSALDPTRDVLVVPATLDGKPTPDAEIRRVVAGPVPVWAYPVWRRSDVARLKALGVQGFVTPDIGYVTGMTPVRRVDSWAMGALTSGEITKSPYGQRYGPRWTRRDALTLDVAGSPAFVLLGQLCPIADPRQSYRVEVDVCFDLLPTDKASHVSIAFGHENDSYYEHGSPEGPGYHAVLAADGGMRIHAHDVGLAEGPPLGAPVKTPPLAAGIWTRVSLEVTPDTITWSRDGFAPVRAADARWRGGYLHVGRSGADGPLSLRALRVSVDGSG
jgi:glycerophosphoryl diester phosphodiesterase